VVIIGRPQRPINPTERSRDRNASVTRRYRMRSTRDGHFRTIRSRRKTPRAARRSATCSGT